MFKTKTYIVMECELRFIITIHDIRKKIQYSMYSYCWAHNKYFDKWITWVVNCIISRIVLCHIFGLVIDLNIRRLKIDHPLNFLVYTKRIFKKWIIMFTIAYTVWPKLTPNNRKIFDNKHKSHINLTQKTSGDYISKNSFKKIKKKYALSNKTKKQKENLTNLVLPSADFLDFFCSTLVFE